MSINPWWLNYTRPIGMKRSWTIVFGLLHAGAGCRSVMAWGADYFTGFCWCWFSNSCSISRACWSLCWLVNAVVSVRPSRIAAAVICRSAGSWGIMLGSCWFRLIYRTAWTIFTDWVSWGLWLDHRAVCGSRRTLRRSAYSAWARLCRFATDTIAWSWWLWRRSVYSLWGALRLLCGLAAYAVSWSRRLLCRSVYSRWGALWLLCGFADYTVVWSCWLLRRSVYSWRGALCRSTTYTTRRLLWLWRRSVYIRWRALRLGSRPTGSSWGALCLLRWARVCWAWRGLPRGRTLSGVFRVIVIAGCCIAYT